MKKVPISSIVLIILGGSGYWYLTNPRVVSSSSEPVTMCNDPDGNDVYRRGTTEYVHVGEDDSELGLEDYCDYFDERADREKGMLREAHCSKGYLIIDRVTCGIGSVCRYGMCMKRPKSIPICADSDVGINPEIRGEINTGGTTRDECWVSMDRSNPDNDGAYTDGCSGSNCYLYEYYCDNDNRNYVIIPSPNGCLNGAQK